MDQNVQGFEVSREEQEYLDIDNVLPDYGKL